MVVNENYWYFEEVVPKVICNHIVRYGKTKNKELGKIGKKKEDEKSNVDVGYRNSNICWLDEPWIFSEILPYIEKANGLAKWNYHLTQPEQCQFTEYKLNQNYNWHQDGFPEPYKTDGSLNGLTRKLSAILALSNKSDYEGGELEFSWFNNRKEIHTQICEPMYKKGSIVVFPSFVWHRVKPIISGERYSIVLWSCGPQWK